MMYMRTVVTLLLVVSQDESSLGDQQWSSRAGHVQGVDSDRDNLLRSDVRAKS